MSKNFRIIYTVLLVVLVVAFGYDFFQGSDPDKIQMIYPFLLGLVLLAGFFSVFLVKAFFSGEFKIYDFLELVFSFFILLIVFNAKDNRFIFISLLGVLLGISIWKLTKKPEEILE